MEYTVKRTYTLRELIARPVPQIPFLAPSTVLEWEVKIDLLEALSELAAADGRKIDESTVVFMEYRHTIEPESTIEATAKALIEA